ncbi:Kelch-like protein diablo [Gryllus bimaculatus]|nr:Kelch-like protein diablo [Gryllus bimaculatus]
MLVSSREGSNERSEVGVARMRFVWDISSLRWVPATVTNIFYRRIEGGSRSARRSGGCSPWAMKMSPQQLLLSWKDHNGALMSVFENLLKRNTLVDCTLAAEGQYVKAHKVVLSACSSYFELLFSQESEKNPIVILKDVKFQELEAAINFMYRGEVEVCEDRLAAFLEVADSLQIKGLGSDGKSDDARGKSPTPKSSKTAVPPKAHSSRKEVTLTESENTVESCITLDSDKNSNESSSHHHLPHRETSGSSSIPSALAKASSFSIPLASTSCPVRVETVRDRDKLEKNQCSSPSVSTFPSGDTVPSDVNTVIKAEPVSDSYVDEKSDESERDFDDVTMMEDQEDWDDPNIESMVDDHSSNKHDPGVKNFKPFNGWLDNFRQRHGVVYKAECGESESEDQQTGTKAGFEIVVVARVEEVESEFQEFHELVSNSAISFEDFVATTRVLTVKELTPERSERNGSKNEHGSG